MTAMTELFVAYGDDAPAALAAWPNLDPVGWSAWQDGLAEREYRARHRRWIARQTLTVPAESKAPKAPPLFDVPSLPAATKPVRSVLVHDGDTVPLTELAGQDGARILRECALRDLGPAETTAARCRRYLELARQIESASEAEGRPVSVAEVIGLAA